MNIKIEDNSLQRYSEVDLLSTQGRIGRRLYFISSIIIPFIFFWVFAGIAGALSHLGDTATLISYAILAMAIIAVVLITIRLTVQRCHDFNKQGRYAFFAIIPLASMIFALIPGTNGLNQYGEPPELPSRMVKLTFGFLLAGLVILIIYIFLKYTSLLFLLSNGL